jgi:hypothetical protein
VINGKSEWLLFTIPYFYSLVNEKGEQVILEKLAPMEDKFVFSSSIISQIKIINKNDRVVILY